MCYSCTCTQYNIHPKQDLPVRELGDVRPAQGRLRATLRLLASILYIHMHSYIIIICIYIYIYITITICLQYVRNTSPRRARRAGPAGSRRAPGAARRCAGSSGIAKKRVVGRPTAYHFPRFPSDGKVPSCLGQWSAGYLRKPRLWVCQPPFSVLLRAPRTCRRRPSAGCLGSSQLSSLLLL